MSKKELEKWKSWREFRIEKYSMDEIEALAATEAIWNNARTEKYSAEGLKGVCGFHESKEKLRKLRDAFVARGHEVQRDKFGEEFCVDEKNQLKSVFKDLHGARLNEGLAAELALFHSYENYKKMYEYFPVF